MSLAAKAGGVGFGGKKGGVSLRDRLKGEKQEQTFVSAICD